MQDRKGFLWFGTQDGLNRYDGYSFIVYRNEPFDTNSISSNWIQTIIQDKEGLLWIGTDHGLNCFNPSTETFQHYTYNATNIHSISNDNITFLYEDTVSSVTENGKIKILWIGTNGGGLNKLVRSSTGEIIIRYTHQNIDPWSLQSNTIFSIYRDHHGTLWIGLNNTTLERFDETTQKFYHYYVNEHGHDHEDSPLADIGTLKEDSRGMFWIGMTVGGLYRMTYNPDAIDSTIHFIHFCYIRAKTESQYGWVNIHSMVWSISEDKNGFLWICHSRGLSQLSIDTAGQPSFINYEHKSTDASSLPINGVWSSFVDNNNTVWLGTYGLGIIHTKTNEKNFHHYRHEPGNPKSLSNVGIRGIYEDNDDILWIGGYEGLNRLDRKTGDVRVYRENNIGPEKNIDNVYVIAENPTSNGTKLWIGQENLGLYLFDKRTERIKRIYKNASNTDSLISPWVYALLSEQDGTLWVGTKDGVDIVRLDPNENPQFRHFIHNVNDSKSYSGSRVNAFLKDSKNILWIATQGGGVNTIDLNNPDTAFVHYVMDEKNPKSISSNQVKCILEDRSGTLWFGTDGGGLNQFNKETQTFQHFTVKDGLPNNVVYGILEDNRGMLWLSTNKGLTRFDPITQVSNTFFIDDGLQSNEFNTGSYLKCKHGELFFGGINGMNTFFPDSIHSNSFIPPVVFTDFKLYNKSISPGESIDGRVILKETISETHEIELTYKENVFSFEFASLDYSSPQKNSYAYILEGFDKTWTSTTGNRRSVTYTNLDAGEYVFRVLGSNSDGVWNKQGAELRIIITPPFWKLWWFIPLIVIVVGGSAFGLAWSRYVHLKRADHERELFSHQLMEQTEDERKRIAFELHDGIGQQLLIIKNMAELGMRKSKVLEEAQKRFGAMSSLAETTVKQLREISHDLHPVEIDRYGVWEAIRSMVAQVEESSGLSIHSLVEPTEYRFSKETEMQIFRIVQEIFNNIIKHSHATDATIFVRKESQAIVVIVEDNGTGFEHENNNTDIRRGFGLSSMEARARAIKSGLHIEVMNGGGTRVRFEIPIQGEAENKG